MTLIGAHPSDLLSLHPSQMAQMMVEAAATVATSPPTDHIQVVLGKRAKLTWERMPEEHRALLTAACSVVLHRMALHLQQRASARVRDPYTPDPEPEPEAITTTTGKKRGLRWRRGA